MKIKTRIRRSENLDPIGNFQRKIRVWARISSEFIFLLYYEKRVELSRSESFRAIPIQFYTFKV